MSTVLVVEDDPETAAEIATELRNQGHEVLFADTGAEAIHQAIHRPLDAITLDRLLPDIDGLEVVERIRREGIQTPVLMLSALSDVDQRITGLRAGGDDYLTKPFVPSEMAVRIEVLLRRTASGKETSLQVGHIVMDLIRREVAVEGKPIRLLHMEFRLLEFLMRHAGRTVSRRTLFEQVWNYHFDPGANLINVHIGRLRRKVDIPGKPSAISTIRGEGYRLDAV